MNPRVSRSSALASKATGFPIAKIAAKLAVGYTLDEIRNDITRETPACFEPTIDYVVTKIPRFTFEKFPSADDVLTTQMKSVGEVMAIGRTFKESFQKALRSLEIGRAGPRAPGAAGGPSWPRRALARRSRCRARAARGRSPRRSGAACRVEEVHRRSRIDPWFLRNLAGDRRDRGGAARGGARRTAPRWLRAREADGLLRPPARRTSGMPARTRCARAPRARACARSTSASTPAPPSSRRTRRTSTRPTRTRARREPTDRRKIMILGGGPNRIGQGIEFDYCCVHAAFALREAGIETIMVNCNPETVSTDYDTSDRLYFEPLTLEDVLEIVRRARSRDGVIVQFGGQTPLRLAVPLERAGVPIIGTSPDAIDRAEDRERFDALLEKLAPAPARRAGIARSAEEAQARRAQHRLPGARAAVLRARRARDGDRATTRQALANYMRDAVQASPGAPGARRPVPRGRDRGRRRLRSATATRVVIGGVMEHIEEAGVHSGDSACSLPPYSLPRDRRSTRSRQPRARSRSSSACVGLMNVQFAVKDDDGLRARGEPARVAHGAVRLEGDRRAAREARRAGDGGQHARRARLHRGDLAASTSR